MTAAIHSISRTTRVCGPPGKRVSIHFQGCSLGCKGCFSEHTWDRSGGTRMPVDDVVRSALELYEDDYRGFTFSGGEPLQQIEALDLVYAELAAARPSATFWVYTGYPLDHTLVRNSVACMEAENVVAGRYDGPHRGEQLKFPSLGLEKGIMVRVGTARITAGGYPR